MAKIPPEFHTYLPGNEAILQMGGEEQVPPLLAIDERWIGLSDGQKSQVIRICNEQKAGHPALLNFLKKERYRETPVDPETFITSPDYLGHVGQHLFPVLRDRLVRILDNDKIREVICSGSIGWGKTYLAHIGICYELYRLLCLKDPQLLFGNTPNTPIIIAALSITGANAKNVMWDYVHRSVCDSPYFRDQNPPWKDTLEWREQNIRFECGSSSEHSIIGENVISGILDEANFLISARQTKRSKMAGEFDQAKVLYDNLERRRISRFLLADGTCFAKFWLLSSKQFPGDFLERRREEAEGDGTVAILDYPVWVPRYSSSQGENRYGSKKFYIYVGNAANRSQILGIQDNVSDSEIARLNLPKAYPITKVSEKDLGEINTEGGCRVQAVPLILYKKYLSDLYGSIRDFSGLSVLARNPFIPNAEIYWGISCLNELGDFQREHPFKEDEPIGVYLDHILGSKIPTILMDPNTLERFDGRKVSHRQKNDRFSVFPQLNPQHPRYVHVDLARSEDGAAFAIGHFGGYKTLVVEEVIEGQPIRFEVERPITIVDVMVRFYAAPGGIIQPKKIREMIWACQRLANFHFEKVTYDSYQSHESIDEFNSQGVTSELHSVDINDRAYTLLRQSLFDGRTSTYEYAPFWQDLSSLERDNKTGKIDHTGTREDGKPGTKDVADCVAALHEHIEEDYASRRSILPYDIGLLEDDARASEKQFEDSLWVDAAQGSPWGSN